MRAIARPERSKAPEDYEQVKLLFDYTKWHIGVYMSLGTIIVSIIGLSNKAQGGGVPPQVSPPIWASVSLLWVAVLCIGLAGLAGGIIASTLTNCRALNGPKGFWVKRTGFWGWAPLRGQSWATIEHTAFWAGVVTGAAAFAFPEVSVPAVLAELPSLWLKWGPPGWELPL